jgi:tRNA A-37 threonylcarbamoyl transferase component Bud32
MTDFITRGAVPFDHPELYVRRQCDTQFDDYLRRNDYIAVIGPRVSGKTSLLVRKFHEMQGKQRALPVYINLTGLSKLSGTAWYERLFELFTEAIRAAGASPITPSFPITTELDVRDALEDALEGNLKARVLILMLDDVETIPKPILTPFMAMIREMFSSREMIPAFKRCVWVLSGCFLPDDLIDDPSISPFRIAERIHMQDADESAVRPLIDLIDEPLDHPTRAVNFAGHFYQWTQGDLYLTQRLCALIDDARDLSLAAMDRLASQTLTEDDIFGRVVRFVEKNTRLMKILQGIETGSAPVRFTRLQRQIAEAWLAGIIKEDAEGNCALRNPVYQTILHLTDPETISRPATTIPNVATPPTGAVIVMPARPLRARYRLESLVGRGGMAQVFRAKDEQTGETVAVKQLLTELTTDKIILERFQREGLSLRDLSHPNIVRFIDFFHEAEHQYIVMEYVRGGTLSELLHREGRGLPVTVAVSIMTGLFDALAHAHRHNVVHRDIKPGNVLLTTDYTPRLADFGVARIVTEHRMTETGLVLGTVPYMSPEACSGEAVSAASDLWSAGVVFFELVTGFLPFNGPNPASIINGIMTAPLPDIATARTDVPLGVAAIIARLLSREINARYPDAATVAAALRSLRF